MCSINTWMNLLNKFVDWIEGFLSRTWCDRSCNWILILKWGTKDFFKLYLLSHQALPSKYSQLVVHRPFTLESCTGGGGGGVVSGIMCLKLNSSCQAFQISTWELSSRIHIFFKFPRWFLCVHAIVWESFLPKDLSPTILFRLSLRYTVWKLKNKKRLRIHVL